MIRKMLLAAGCAALTGCAAVPAADPQLPPDAGWRIVDPADVERLLLDAARDRYGVMLVDQAVSSPSYLVVQRSFGGIPVPPRPGEPFPPPPPPGMALIAQRSGVWVFAENGAWRQARPAQIARIEAIAASAEFKAEPVHIPPCPDYGSARLLLKMAGTAKIARDHACPSHTDRLITAVLEA